MNKELLATIGSLVGVTVGTALVGYGLFLGGKYAYNWYRQRKISQRLNATECCAGTEPEPEPQTS